MIPSPSEAKMGIDSKFPSHFPHHRAYWAYLPTAPRRDGYQGMKSALQCPDTMTTHPANTKW